MKRRRRKKNRLRGSRPRGTRLVRIKTKRICRQALDLVMDDEIDEALDLLFPQLEEDPNNFDLHQHIGMAYAHAGDFQGALKYYRRSVELAPREHGLQFPLGFTYAQTAFYAHAKRCFQRFLSRCDYADPEMIEQARQMLVPLNDEIEMAVQSQGLPKDQVEEGLYWMEEGRYYAQRGEFEKAKEASEGAIKSLPRFPPCYNNLATAQFYLGDVDAAIQLEIQVIETMDADNVHALANLIRFCTMANRGEAANRYFEKLQSLDLDFDIPDLIEKVLEGYSAVEADRAIFDFLKAASREVEDFSDKALYIYGAAAANLEKFTLARRHWSNIDPNSPYREVADRCIEAARRKQPGAGLSDRYPYIPSFELVPFSVISEMGDALKRIKDEDKAAEKAKEFAGRYPQLIPFAVKRIWEEDSVEMGISFLSMLRTPEAYQELRRFALGQKGSDADRHNALMALWEAGEVSGDSPVRFWQGGEWQDLLRKKYEITDAPESAYPQEIINLLAEGVEAGHQEDYDRAVGIYEKILSINPHVKEAYANMGGIYYYKGEDEKARESMQKALEIDPLYVFPRVNLAMTSLHEDKIDEAHEWLKPLTERDTFHPDAMLIYQRVLFEIALAEKDFEKAKNYLQLLLELDPENEELKERGKVLEMMMTLQEGLFGDDSIFARMHQRAINKRERAKSTPISRDVRLKDCLSGYTKDQLVGMLRALGIYYGASGWKKAQMFDRVVGVLKDASFVQESLLPTLSEQEGGALKAILDNGGAMSWEAFAEEYADDLDESPHWNYHQPESVMGRLRVRGLIEEGQVESEPAVLIPFELREPMKSWFAER